MLSQSYLCKVNLSIPVKVSYARIALKYPNKLARLSKVGIASPRLRLQAAMCLERSIVILFPLSLLEGAGKRIERAERRIPLRIDTLTYRQFLFAYSCVGRTLGPYKVQVKKLYEQREGAGTL